MEISRRTFLKYGGSFLFASLLNNAFSCNFNKNKKGKVVLWALNDKDFIEDLKRDWGIFNRRNLYNFYELKQIDKSFKDENLNLKEWFSNKHLALRTYNGILKNFPVEELYFNYEYLIKRLKELSRLSLKYPLPEVVFDDVSKLFCLWKKWRGYNLEEKVNGLIDATKSRNRQLKFGISLYEDNLGKGPDSYNYLGMTFDIVSSVRHRVDFVHFFLHLREDCFNIPDYVKEISVRFPNARIILGNYDYNRIDVEPERFETNKRTVEEELKLFKYTLDKQFELVKSGKIYGVEFFPGQIRPLQYLPKKFKGNPQSIDPKPKIDTLPQLVEYYLTGKDI